MARGGAPRPGNNESHASDEQAVQQPWPVDGEEHRFTSNHWHSAAPGAQRSVNRVKHNSQQPTAAPADQLPPEHEHATAAHASVFAATVYRDKLFNSSADAVGDSEESNNSQEPLQGQALHALDRLQRLRQSQDSVSHLHPADRQRSFRRLQWRTFVATQPILQQQQRKKRRRRRFRWTVHRPLRFDFPRRQKSQAVRTVRIYLSDEVAASAPLSYAPRGSAVQATALEARYRWGDSSRWRDASLTMVPAASGPMLMAEVRLPRPAKRQRAVHSKDPGGQPARANASANDAPGSKLPPLHVKMQPKHSDDSDAVQQYGSKHRQSHGSQPHAKPPSRQPASTSDGGGDGVSQSSSRQATSLKYTLPCRAGSYLLTLQGPQRIMHQPATLLVDPAHISGNANGSAAARRSTLEFRRFWLHSRRVHDCRLAYLTPRPFRAFGEFWRDVRQLLPPPDVLVCGGGTRLYVASDQFWEEDLRYREQAQGRGWQPAAVRAAVDDVLLQYSGQQQQQHSQLSQQPDAATQQASTAANEGATATGEADASQVPTAALVASIASAHGCRGPASGPLRLSRCSSKDRTTETQVPLSGRAFPGGVPIIAAAVSEAPSADSTPPPPKARYLRGKLQNAQLVSFQVKAGLAGRLLAELRAQLQLRQQHGYRIECRQRGSWTDVTVMPSASGPETALWYMLHATSEAASDQLVMASPNPVFLEAAAQAGCTAVPLSTRAAGDKRGAAGGAAGSGLHTPSGQGRAGDAAGVAAVGSGACSRPTPQSAPLPAAADMAGSVAGASTGAAHGKKPMGQRRGTNTAPASTAPRNTRLDAIASGLETPAGCILEALATPISSAAAAVPTS